MIEAVVKLYADLVDIILESQEKGLLILVVRGECCLCCIL
jgi:hypothetical protein